MSNTYREPYGVAKLVKIPKREPKEKTKQGFLKNILNFDESRFENRFENNRGTRTPSTVSCTSRDTGSSSLGQNDPRNRNGSLVSSSKVMDGPILMKSSSMSSSGSGSRLNSVVNRKFKPEFVHSNQYLSQKLANEASSTVSCTSRDTSFSSLIQNDPRNRNGSLISRSKVMDDPRLMMSSSISSSCSGSRLNSEVNRKFKPEFVHSNQYLSQKLANEACDLVNLNENLKKSAKKITTTVTVHLSSNDKTLSNLNLSESFGSSDNLQRTQNQGKSNNIPLNKFKSSWNLNSSRNRISEKEHHFASVNHDLFPNHQRNFQNTKLSRSNSKSLNDINTSFHKFSVPVHHQNALTSERTNKQNNLQEQDVNFLQVFRQSKYKARNKAERKINQIEHLNNSMLCNEVAHQLREGFQSKNYENIEKLKFIDYMNKEGFITSKKSNVPVIKHRNSRNLEPKRINVEPIYAEIPEDEAEINLKARPNFRKKVTFSSFHQPIQEVDPFLLKKMILPAEFIGIVQVNEQLRSKTDSERRRMAALCYEVIRSGKRNHSMKFLGHVDTSRGGESIYLVLGAISFDVQDSDGMFIAKHKFTDISVIIESIEDYNVLTYIGRCKFNGRIGLAFKLFKSKHVSIVLEAFKNRAS